MAGSLCVFTYLTPVQGNLHFLDGSLCGGEAGDGHAERAAGDIVQADLVAELDGRGIAAVLAADANRCRKVPVLSGSCTDVRWNYDCSFTAYFSDDRPGKGVKSDRCACSVY